MRSRAEIDTALQLLARGLSAAEVARVTGIPRGTVRDWHLGRVPNAAPDGRRLVVGGCVCQGADPPKARTSYAYLLGLYLGDGYINRAGRTYRLRFTLDSAYPQIVTSCANALEELMPGKRAYGKQRRGQRCTDVGMYSSHWPCLFPQHGPGRKHQRPIVLTGWQDAIVADQRKAFLRGLIHSDGCRIIANDRGRPAPRYLFSNRSPDIHALFRASLDAIGVAWTSPRTHETAVYGLAGVAELDVFAGPKR